MSDNYIRVTELLIKRNGEVWHMPDRQAPERRVGPYPTQMGTVLFEARGKSPKRGWRFHCKDCSSFQGAIRRTRREAVLDLIDHWNEER